MNRKLKISTLFVAALALVASLTACGQNYKRRGDGIAFVERVYSPSFSSLDEHSTSIIEVIVTQYLGEDDFG